MYCTWCIFVKEQYLSLVLFIFCSFLITHSLHNGYSTLRVSTTKHVSFLFCFSSFQSLTIFRASRYFTTLLRTLFVHIEYLVYLTAYSRFAAEALRLTTVVGFGSLCHRCWYDSASTETLGLNMT